LSNTRHASAETRARLGHPVIDGDGHIVEYGPTYKDCPKQVAGSRIVQRFETVMSRHVGAYWFNLGTEQRRESLHDLGLCAPPGADRRPPGAGPLALHFPSRQHRARQRARLRFVMGQMPGAQGGADGALRRHGPGQPDIAQQLCLIGMFAAAHESFAKALVTGGVTCRFPMLKVGFLEGGVGWGSTRSATWSAIGKSATAAPSRTTIPPISMSTRRCGCSSPMVARRSANPERRCAPGLNA
jgi:hypothetical protein